jgi:hypothetical protein
MEEIDLYSQCEGLTGEACIARLETIQAIPDTLPEPQGEDIPSVGGLVLLVLVGAGIWTVVRRQRIIPEQIMPLLPASPAQYIPYPTAPGAPTYTEDEVSEKLADLEYKLTNPFREQPAPVWAPSQPETVANQRTNQARNALIRCPNQVRTSLAGSSKHTRTTALSRIESGKFGAQKQGTTKHGGPLENATTTT